MTGGSGRSRPAESRELLEVLEDRCQSKSTVVASQAPVDKWYELMPDSTVADAVMDRLVHNARPELQQPVLAERNRQASNAG